MSSFNGISVKSIVPRETPDIAICHIDINNLPPQITTIPCAKIVNSSAVNVGQTVGILGFPQGVEFPVKYESTAKMQLMPLLQTGAIAGMLPCSGLEKPSSFVLDIVVNPGCSGSPVFLPNGDVIGIVFATRQRFCELVELDAEGELSTNDEKGVLVPSGLGLAVPSAQLPDDWMNMVTGQ